MLALDFHPTFSVLASGSNDCTIKFFDYSKPSVKRSYRAIQEVASIKTLMFHPSGDYMLIGTEQPTCEFKFNAGAMRRFSGLFVLSHPSEAL